MSARLLLFFAALVWVKFVYAMPASATSTKNVDAISAADLNIPPKYKLTPVEFDSIRGTYTLSDGRRLKVWTDRHKLFADLDSRSLEILAEEKNTFVSRDRSMKLRFQFDAPDPIVTVSEK